MQVLAAIFFLFGALLVVITVMPWLNGFLVDGRPWQEHLLLWAPIATTVLILAFVCNSLGK